MSLASAPLAIGAVVVLAFCPTSALPIAVAIAAVFAADIPSREVRSGTLSLVFSHPHLRERFVAWKFLATVFVVLTLTAIPIARNAFATPSSLPAMTVGLVFLSATITLLGIASSGGKAFLLVFLSFWYLVVSDRGATAALDFAGFFGKATPAITASYAAGAAAALAAAYFIHARRL